MLNQGIARKCLIVDLGPDQMALLTALKARGHVLVWSQPFILLGGTIHGLESKLLIRNVNGPI